MSEADLPFNVDLTNCDREPIHQLGAIQSIGFMVVISPGWMVDRASANIGDYFPVTAAEAIGMPIVGLFSDEAVHAVRNRLALLRGPDAVERMIGCSLGHDDALYDIALHMSDGCVVIEAEPTTDKHYGDPTGTVRGMIARLDKAPDISAFFSESARQVRALTGFDRVMVYRFDPDGSGHVIAESARSGIGSFLGLHYPPSDIPRQARALYLRSLLRIIADIDAVPVPIIPAFDDKGRPLDLSLSMLRSVSPIHLEYLRNMGVRASMSISIIVEGELWGLIACHHHSPRCTSFERRSIAELFAQMLAMRIESRERELTVAYEQRARDISNQLLGAVASDESLLKTPDRLADILTHVIPSEGLGVCIGGRHAIAGLTPDASEFARIIDALIATGSTSIFAAERISDLVPTATAYADRAAGMLAIPVSRSPRDYIVLFRPEVVRTVSWGGDPNKSVTFGPNGPRLHPRESFAEWKELVKGSSPPFTAPELRVAETLRATLVEVIPRMADDDSVERRQSNERQKLLIAELNHRVRNILSLIRGLIRQSKPSADTTIEEFVAMVDGRVHALARAHNQITNDHWGPAPLRNLIDAEVAFHLSKRKDKVVIKGDPVLLNPQAYSTLALVLHELVSNSAKYGALKGAGQVEISWSRKDKLDLTLIWTETGGPRVSSPTRKGFGSTIIELSVPYDLGGASTLEYRPEGVHATFVIPARHVSEELVATPVFPGFDDQAAAAEQVRAPHDLLAGKRVLLVEDSLIIALDAEDILRRLGAFVVVADGTVSGAIAAIGYERPDLAVLDINLGDHDSFAIADCLDDAGVPFLFATGYGDQATLPERHRARFVMQKPYTLQMMARHLPDLLAEVAAKA